MGAKLQNFYIFTCAFHGRKIVINSSEIIKFYEDKKKITYIQTTRDTEQVKETVDEIIETMKKNEYVHKVKRYEKAVLAPPAKITRNKILMIHPNGLNNK